MQPYLFKYPQSRWTPKKITSRSQEVNGWNFMCELAARIFFCICTVCMFARPPFLHFLLNRTVKGGQVDRNHVWFLLQRTTEFKSQKTILLKAQRPLVWILNIAYCSIAADYRIIYSTYSYSNLNYLVLRAGWCWCCVAAACFYLYVYRYLYLELALCSFVFLPIGGSVSVYVECIHLFLYSI